MIKTKKLINIFIISIVIILGMNTIVFADLVNPIDNPSTWKPDSSKIGSSDKIVSASGKMIGIVRNVGIIVGVIVLSIIGFKYMLGSIEEKAKYKETMIPYVIGAVVLMSGTVLVELLYNVASKF
ncbi:MAG: pilin [Clostridia bacterium]|nr:pilin [Clostridia bacterium]